MLKRRLAGSTEYGGWCRVIRTVDQGLDPLDETGAPALAAATIARHAGRACRRSGARAGMGGRGLSHPQDGPLTLTGAFELHGDPAGPWLVVQTPADGHVHLRLLSDTDGCRGGVNLLLPPGYRSARRPELHRDGADVGLPAVARQRLVPGYVVVEVASELRVGAVVTSPADVASRLDVLAAVSQPFTQRRHDVRGEVVDEPGRPHQQRAVNLLGNAAGLILAAISRCPRRPAARRR
jgi:hypothetical protein